MKKSSERLPEDSLERYDATKATRGKHAGKLATGTPWRRLEDELADAFPTSGDVNAALRAVLALRAVVGVGVGEPKRSKQARKAA